MCSARHNKRVACDSVSVMSLKVLTGSFLRFLYHHSLIITRVSKILCYVFSSRFSRPHQRLISWAFVPHTWYQVYSLFITAVSISVVYGLCIWPSSLTPHMALFSSISGPVQTKRFEAKNKSTRFEAKNKSDDGIGNIHSLWLAKSLKWGPGDRLGSF